MLCFPGWARGGAASGGELTPGPLYLPNSNTSHGVVTGSTCQDYDSVGLVWGREGGSTYKGSQIPFISIWESAGFWSLYSKTWPLTLS